MTAKITTLIDKRDNMEIIRDEIAAILAVEIANQKVLAIADGQDPSDYDFNIYVERSNPWEIIEQSEGNISSQVPLVNVYLDSANIIGSQGTDVTTTVYSVKYNIDCLSAKNTKIESGVKYHGDELAARDAQRICRLVRNILQSASYRRMNYSSIFNNRSVGSISMFQPQISERSAQNIIGARIVYSATITEYAPEYVAPLMELIQGECSRADDGRVYFEIEYDVSDT